MKTNFDVSKMTRAQGEKAVAATMSLEMLKALGDHKNSHVRAKAAYKYGKIDAEQLKAFGETVAILNASDDPAAAFADEGSS